MKLQDGERVIKGNGAQYVKGKISVVGGVLTLTDRRLAFDQRNPIATAFGLLGALVLGPILPRKTIVDLPLGQIASYSRGKFGRNTNVLAIATRDANEYRFIAKFEEWVPVLTHAGIPVAQSALVP